MQQSKGLFLPPFFLVAPVPFFLGAPAPFLFGEHNNFLQVFWPESRPDSMIAHCR